MIKKWDSATTTRFVQEYAKHTCLWDVNNENYKSRAARDAAVEDIVRNMGMSDLHPNDVKCKIRIIRNTYINEMKKIREKKRLVGGKHVSYVCNIPWFETADQFLRKVVRKKKYPANLVSLDESRGIETESRTPRGEETDGGEFEQSDLYEEGTYSGQEFAHDLLSITYQNDSSYQNKQIKEESHEESEIEEVSQHSCLEDESSLPPQSIVFSSRTDAQSPSSLYSSQSPANAGAQLSSEKRVYDKEKNEFDIFAKNVAAQLKQLPLENALMVQAKIHELLIKERLRVIRKSQRNRIVIESGDEFDEEFGSG